MEKIKKALQHSVKVLNEDIFTFRQIILKSEGGVLPPDIIEKQALVKEIEELLSYINRPRVAR